MRARRSTLLGVVAAALAAAAPAQAINDPTVPGNECSNENSAAVGNTPDGSNPGIANSPQVAPVLLQGGTRGPAALHSVAHRLMHA